jgi:hypothetical protein
MAGNAKGAHEIHGRLRFAKYDGSNWASPAVTFERSARRLPRLLDLEGTKILDQVAGALIADHGVGVIHAGKDLIPGGHFDCLVIKAEAKY